MTSNAYETQIITVTTVQTVVNTLQVRRRSGPEYVAENVLKEEVAQPTSTSPVASTTPIPELLSTFEPEALSSACRLNVEPPSQLPVVTETAYSVAVESSYVSEPSLYISRTDIVSADDTVSYGTAFTTINAPPYTLTIFHTVVTTVIETHVTSDVTTQTTHTEPATPKAYLSRPTAIVGDANEAPFDVDDKSYPVTAPFELTLYEFSTSSIFVSTNGVSHHLVQSPHTIKHC